MFTPAVKMSTFKHFVIGKGGGGEGLGAGSLVRNIN